MNKLKIERIGEINNNTFGTKMKIIEYYNNINIVIEFQDEYKVRKHCGYKEFKNGKVKNPYDREVYGIGYIGVGKYNKKDYVKIYTCWKNMLRRCYDPYEINKYITYKDVFVCEEWLNFQNFAKWYEENIYYVNDERMELDKDILIKGNKIYSPSTCIFVPRRINLLFTKRDSNRGELPIGCSYNKRCDNIYVYCDIFDREYNKNKRKSLKYVPLDRPFQAFTIYKNFKESYIKQVANEYKKNIPKRLYDALMNYKVEIND